MYVCLNFDKAKQVGWILITHFEEFIRIEVKIITTSFKLAEDSKHTQKHKLHTIMTQNQP